MSAETEDRVVPGRCYCGGVTFEVTLPSRFCAHCHCGNCRRAHGAAFVTYAGFPERQFALTGGGDLLVRYRTDTGATRSFCRRCGTTLLYEGPRWAGEVHVARACIDGEIDRAPEAHVEVDNKATWWTFDDDLPRLGGTSGSEKKP